MEFQSLSQIAASGTKPQTPATPTVPKFQSLTQISAAKQPTTPAVVASDNNNSVTSKFPTLTQIKGGPAIPQNNPSPTQPQGKNLSQTVPGGKGLLGNLFPNTYQQLQDPSEGFDLKKAGEDAVNTIKSAFTDEYQRMKDYIEPNQTPSQLVSSRTKVLSGAANVVFSPISAIFAGAKHIPILDQVAKVVTLPFSVAGEGATGISNAVIDKLPLSQKTKDTIKPGIGEIFALAAQIAVGRVVEAKGEKFNELKTKYGEKDATTIVNKANELAKEKMAAPVDETPAKVSGIKPKVVESELYDSGKIEGYDIGKTKKYSTIHEGGKTKIVEGTPVKITDGIDTFLHEGDGGWVVSESSTGRYIADSRTKGGAIAKADTIISQFGEDKFRQTIANKQLNNTDKLRTPETSPQIPADRVEQGGGVVPQAQTEVTPQVGEGSKVSGVAKQIEAKAVEKGLVDKGYNELANYDSSTIKEQSNLATKYSVDEINKIATGESPLPKELKPGTPLSIAEDYAIKNNDIDLLRKLAKSPLATQISDAASELSLSRMRDSNSPVTIARDIYKTKEEAFKKKYNGKTIKEVVDKQVAKGEKMIKPPKAFDWSAIIKEVRC